MPKQTLLQFEGERSASACGVCGQHFSGDARFCPFDGEPLSAAPEWDPTGDPLIGSVIDDRYAIEGVLGEGGMGTVYQVRHTSLGRAFALKALRRDLAEDPELAPRFTQEAKAAARIAHPHVVQITDFGNLPSGQPYFVMELVEGHPLGRVMRESGPLPMARAANIARQIAEALAAAHGSGVVHRDLKPDNVQVVPSPAGDIIKVLDFGLAKVAGTSRFTRKGMVFGTPHYMSPEQAAGDPADHRVDIYALGIVMYEMLVGWLPFEADSFMGVLSKHMYEVPPAPSTASGARDPSPVLDRIVMRCLEKKPDDRYASMGELVQVLSELSPASLSERPPAPVTAQTSEPDLTRSGLPPASMRPSRRRLVWVAAALGGITLGLAYTAYRSRAPHAVAPSPTLAPSAARVSPEPSSQPEPAPDPVPARPPMTPSATAASAKPAPAVPHRPAQAAKTAPKPAAPAAAPRPKSPKAASFTGSDIVNPWGE